MLSFVLGSARHRCQNIEITRTFVRVRYLAATHVDLAKRLTRRQDRGIGHEPRCLQPQHPESAQAILDPIDVVTSLGLTQRVFS
jgi:hypothetical protein